MYQDTLPTGGRGPEQRGWGLARATLKIQPGQGEQCTFQKYPFPRVLTSASYLQAAGKPKESADDAQRLYSRVVVCASGHGVGSTGGALRRPCRCSFSEERASQQHHEQRGSSRRADPWRCRARLPAGAMLAFLADAARAVPRAQRLTRGNSSATPSAGRGGKQPGWRHYLARRSSHTAAGAERALFCVSAQVCVY